MALTLLNAAATGNQWCKQATLRIGRCGRMPLTPTDSPNRLESAVSKPLLRTTAGAKTKKKLHSYYTDQK
ncbi:MAG: hypothetical protein AAB403_12845 [Planctomycetota bacterium]